MHKKVYAILLSTAVVILVAAIFIGADNDTEPSSGLSVADKNVYEIMLVGNEVCLFEIKNGEKELIKKAEAADVRKSDYVILRQGIRSENREDALMIFEDFIS